jgi:tRNA G46 methylase TrmB
LIQCDEKKLRLDLVLHFLHDAAEYSEVQMDKVVATTRISKWEMNRLKEIEKIRQVTAEMEKENPTRVSEVIQGA